MFQSHPGTTTIAIDLYNEDDSLQSLWKQVEGYKRVIYPIMQSHPDGVHLICYSQGYSVLRSVLSYCFSVLVQINSDFFFSHHRWYDM